MKLPCLSAVCAGCPELRSLNLSCCRHISLELLLTVARRAPRLRGLDLSAVEPRSVVSAATLGQLAAVVGGRLTELTLARNLLSGLPQVVTELAVSEGGVVNSGCDEQARPVRFDGPSAVCDGGWGRYRRKC